MGILQNLNPFQRKSFDSSEQLLENWVRTAMRMEGATATMPIDKKTRIEMILDNPIASMSVRRISWSVGSVRWLVDNKDEGDLADLLNKPREHDRFDLFTLAAASLASDGNAYFIKSNRASGQREKGPAALFFLRPDRMTIKTSPTTGRITHYEYRHATKTQIYQPDEICHVKHPWLLDDYCGESIMPSLFDSLNLYAGYTTLRQKILQNSGGVPSILVFEGGGMSDLQRAETKEMMEDFKLGGDNFGATMLMDSGSTGGSVKKIEMAGDIQRLQPNETMAKIEQQVVQLFGVPRLLLGIGGDATFANQAEARRYFWLDILMPGYIEPIAAALSRFLDVDVTPDEDSIPAIADYRLSVVSMLKAADWLTVNEKREWMGYNKVKGGDEVMQPANLIPLEDPAAVGDASGFTPGVDDQPLEPDGAATPPADTQAVERFTNDITGA